MAKLIRILSIDGGGIRGIIPGQVLVNLEAKLKERSGNPAARIADYFDLIAGTSTGGILTCLYLCPDIESDSTRPKYSARQAVDLYLSKGNRIFDVSIWQNIKSAHGFLDEKYNAKQLENALNDYLGDIKLSELIKPCLITAYDIYDRKTKFFTQHDAKKHDKDNFLVRDIARGTSAAPTYFEVARIESFSSVPYALVDGGLFANNPALCAYSEARNKFKEKPKAENIAILSIGTGYVKERYNYDDAKDWSMLKWAKPIINISMSGVSETVHYQLTQIFDTIDDSDQYLRIDGELHFSSHDLDDATEQNLLKLKQDGSKISDEFNDQLDNFIKYLVT